MKVTNKDFLLISIILSVIALLYSLNLDNFLVGKIVDVETSATIGTVTTTTTSTSTSTTTSTTTTEEAPSKARAAKKIISDFTLDKNLIIARLKQGDSKRETVTITNIGGTTLNIETDPQELRRFMIISEESFVLKPREVKTINIDIFAKIDEIADAYVGRILIKSEDTTKTINTIIEVLKRKALFDIRTVILKDTITAGEKVKADITLINLGDLRPVDVTLFYAIKDFDDNIINFKEETLAVDTEITITRELETPRDLEDGNYIFYSKITYNEQVAVSSDVIKVIKKEVQEPAKVKPEQVVISILVIVVLLTVYLKHRKYRSGKIRRRKSKTR